MAKRHTNWAAWSLATVLAAGVLGGIGLMAVWLRWYWAARHHGSGVNLPGVRPC